MQRQIACGDDQIERGNLRAGSERGDDTILDLQNLRSLDVAERKYILVEEALLRQGAKEFEAIVIDGLPIGLDRVLQQSAADGSEQPLQLEIVDDLRLQQRQQHGFPRHRARALSAEQFGKPQLSRPGIGETLQWRRHRGALLDEDLRITQPERHGMGEMRDRLVHAAERLVGDGDIVVGRGVSAVEFKRLAEQLYRQFVAAALLHDVAQQHEAAQVAGFAAERQAAKVFRLDELAFAVMRYSRSVNIVGLGGLKRAVGRSRRQRGPGLFGRRSSCLPVHFRSLFKDCGIEPARLSG